MDIIIPTHGRAGKQETAKRLAHAGIEFHTVVQADEAHLFGGNVWVLPRDIKTIAPTRQWILENVGGSRSIVMLDDDLVFFRRREDDATKLRDITGPELAEMFLIMERQLHICAHVGIAAREGANRVTAQFVPNTRIMRVLGYDRNILLEDKIRFDAIPLMEDFHVALSLLERGYPNMILNSYANNQGGSGSAGGCSLFRTKELQRECALKLKELHPQFVTVVEKETKGSFGGGIRTDVRIQWKECYKHGKSLCGTGLLDHGA